MDPVRFLSNPSTGKMGFALAEAAQRRGAEVTLVAGPVSLATPHGVRRLDVVSAEEMLIACQKQFRSCDIFIASAAVGDYSPPKKSQQKLKKSSTSLALKLEPTVDILKTLGQSKGKRQVVVGFAAETRDLLGNAKEKLKKKNLDLIVANDVSQRDIGFGSEDNRVILLDRAGRKTTLEKLPKLQVAEHILDAVEKLLHDV